MAVFAIARGSLGQIAYCGRLLQTVGAAHRHPRNRTGAVTVGATCLNIRGRVKRGSLGRDCASRSWTGHGHCESGIVRIIIAVVRITRLAGTIALAVGALMVLPGNTAPVLARHPLFDAIATPVTASGRSIAIPAATATAAIAGISQCVPLAARRPARIIRIVTRIIRVSRIIGIAGRSIVRSAHATIGEDPILALANKSGFGASVLGIRVRFLTCTIVIRITLAAAAI